MSLWFKIVAIAIESAIDLRLARRVASASNGGQSKRQEQVQDRHQEEDGGDTGDGLGPVAEGSEGVEHLVSPEFSSFRTG